MTSGRLADKVALVTGAASGIGRATAQAMLREGACVVGSDITPLKASDIASEGPVRAEAHDVRSEDDWNRVVDATVAHFGGLDILVNCAGVNFDPEQPGFDPLLEDLPIGYMRGILGVNLEGTVIGCRTAIAAMRARGGGAIVNVSSIAAHKGWPGRAPYAMSKAAVLQFTKSVAIRSAKEKFNIRCNAVAPGPVATPMLVPLSAPHRSEGSHAGSSHVPLDRFAEPEEIANAILFLASDEASYITGAELVVDGGLMAV